MKKYSKFGEIKSFNTKFGCKQNCGRGVKSEKY